MIAPDFSTAVAPDGYCWWYLDALDPQSGHGLTIIIFIGSVFSPGYARARARGPTDPLDFCAVNVALYGRPGAWVMTEHPRATVTRDATALRIGGTEARYTADGLVVRVCERSAPGRRRVEGEVRLVFADRFDLGHALAPAGGHRWWPVAPVAWAEARFTHPAVHFHGPAYHDVNRGEAPLERHFRAWDWSRVTDGERTDVLYDATLADGTPTRFGARFGQDGRVTPIDPAETVILPRGGWGVPRATRVRQGETARVVQTLEDTPFYTRSWLERRGPAGTQHGVHESLDLGRFDSAWVRFLLPFRMRGGWRW